MTAIETRLTMAVTAYDRTQAGKPGYNVYALPILLGRVGEASADIRRGAPVREAVIAAFTGRLLTFVLRHIGEPRLSAAERESTRHGSATYRPARPIGG